MKKLHPYVIAALYAIAVFPLANLGAATLDKSKIQITDWPVQVDAAADTNSNTTPTSNAGSGQGSSGNVSGSSNSSVNMNAGSGRFDLSSDSSARINVSDSEPISIDRGTESQTADTASVSGTSNSSVTFDRVSTENDLRSFMAASLTNDEDLQGMTFTNNAVEVSYKAPGKFLALIPMYLTTTARVDASGDVSVRYPWYSFLVKNDTNTDLATSIKTEIQSMISANGGTLTAGQAAAIASRIHAIFKGDATAPNTASNASGSYGNSTSTSATSTSGR
ncbi:MAG: hypothetical protein JWN89_57 [Parcubacteria group bacterium]|nr:hypothetical protein [Parcubacteria group bacterium]